MQGRPLNMIMCSYCGIVCNGVCPGSRYEQREEVSKLLSAMMPTEAPRVFAVGNPTWTSDFYDQVKRDE